VKQIISRLLLSSVVMAVFLTIAGSSFSPTSLGGDWPQWRGENRDGRVTGFTPPQAWPKELTQKWKIPVGEGVATPALVGDKLFVFTWEGDKEKAKEKTKEKGKGGEMGMEVLRCLEAESGKELWKYDYKAARASGAASGFAGARSSPTVSGGKVVTLGVQGMLSCVNASSGEKIWSKETPGHPRFFTSSSPIVVDGLCIAQFGGEDSGGIAAYDLEKGDEKWKWTGDGTAYASPVLLTVDGTKMIVTETSKNIVGISLSDGKLLWKMPFAGEQRAYNACTPIVDGQTVIFSGSNRGTKAIKIEKKDDGFATKELWSNPDNSVQFNSPVVHDGLVFGLTISDKLFCIKADGKTAWSSEIKGKKGYGSIVDTGSVLLSLTPAGQLIVYEPSDKEFKELATYKVSGSETYAYPVIAGKRIYVKDKDSLIMYTIE
jgi:outer membrane protein assembly factor BamB